ncbi:MAG: peptidoglycan DD-metalloendopeptidase family protein [Acutalibacteraceae bacterium]|nr:peptidoglycan DD-metalloendopeptidase family protein [Acutalibacteraceae bacterium]
MNKIIKRSVSVFLCFCLTLLVFNSTNWITSADTAGSLRDDIAALQKESQKLEAEIQRLKNDKKDQATILAAIQKKIANIQAQVLRCNKEINAINEKIAANKKEIDAKNTEIEASKLEFKKRLRAIYMSNSGSNIQLLLGADDFSDFLQLSQLTASVSARDKRMIEDMIAVIKELEAKNAENQKLLDEQVAVRATVVAAQKELEAEEAAAQSLYDSIAADQKQAEKDNANVEAVIKEKTNYLNKLLYGGSSTSFINSKVGFVWPVPSCQNITSYYGPRWGTMHRGIDISGGGIFGKPIVAITDGTVYEVYNSCPHKDRGSRCRCGSGWGNHVAIDHGYVQGERIKAMYAHMNTTAVSNGQHVKQGQVIGYVGTTGDSTGYHLHFGIMRNNEGYVNPMNYYSK